MNPRPFPYGIRFVQFETRRREALERTQLEQARRAARLRPHVKPELGMQPAADDVARSADSEERRAA